MAAISHMVTISCMVATMVAMVTAIFYMVAIWPSMMSAGVNMVAIFQIRRGGIPAFVTIWWPNGGTVLWPRGM